MPTATPSQDLRDYTNIAVEILVVVLTLAPILVLLYFYPGLPDQIPVFLNFRGEAEVWAAKSVASVFRVPAMAIDTQLICLLMKYGTVRSQRISTELKGVDEVYLDHQTRATVLAARLWDWLRCMVAFKMAAASLEVVFMSNEQVRFLWTPAWAVTWLAALLSIAAAGWYGYRLWRLKRQMTASGITWKEINSRALKSSGMFNSGRVLGGFLYYNPNDPAMFVDKHLFNFGNKWVYVLIGCIVAYPLLVFIAT